jgi:hypothetical protein
LLVASGLAATEATAGRFDRAAALHETTLATRLELAGMHYPQELRERAELAAVYRQKGDTGRALELDRETLAARQDLLGPEHPDTEASRRILADSYPARPPS